MKVGYRRKKNNDGMSLIEVIVSMLILAIIAVPLLSSFTLSSNINNKTRLRQYATVLGQNIMEGVKNTDLGDVALAMNGVASGGGLAIVPDSAMPAGYTHGVDFYETASAVSDSAISYANASVQLLSGNYKFKENSANQYYYILKNVMEGTKAFDVRIDYDGNGYRPPTPSPSSPSSIVVKQNNYEQPILSNFDIQTTALIDPNFSRYDFYKNPTTNQYEDDAAHPGFYKINSDTVYDKAIIDGWHSYYVSNTPVASVDPDAREKIQKNTSRETVITIESKPSGLAVSCKYIYEYSGSLTISTGSGIQTVVKPLYNVDGFSGKLKNIFLFHAPLETNMWKTDGDVVTVINKSLMTEDLNVYVAEQPLDYYDISKAHSIFVRAFKNDACTIMDNRTKFFYETPGAGVIDVGPAYTLNSNVTKTSLIDYLDSRSRIYKVKVSIYPHGSSELLYQLESTVTR